MESGAGSYREEGKGRGEEKGGWLVDESWWHASKWTPNPYAFAPSPSPNPTIPTPVG